ncbi:hypothetical protein P7228_12235 [Altererythrobacter arenosus]|uniref:DUF1049 domain-containing protein n=1 Tax=Altererythrobacter arenosus TaxID=3032592 RepID=A0ABY8FRM5_9SPHN|nr:hypothetical protein [Altererythrobacter sp. CAU 1644]WFL76760.1 hypothetical protein P7228_12235 [Altererythrobacter sp. CAU 1644]
MKVVRTIVWILILVVLLAFSALNWKPVEVTLWSDLVLETKVPALVIVAFLLGLIPMWLVHRGVKWQQGRRIQSLENAVKSSALARHAPTPTATAETTPDPAPAPAPAATEANETPTSDEPLTPSKDA